MGMQFGTLCGSYDCLNKNSCLWGFSAPLHLEDLDGYWTFVRQRMDLLVRWICGILVLKFWRLPCSLTKTVVKTWGRKSGDSGWLPQDGDTWARQWNSHGDFSEMCRKQAGVNPDSACWVHGMNPWWPTEVKLPWADGCLGRAAKGR